METPYFFLGTFCASFGNDKSSLPASFKSRDFSQKIGNTFRAPGPLPRCSKDFWSRWITLSRFCILFSTLFFGKNLGYLLFWLSACWCDGATPGGNGRSGSPLNGPPVHRRTWPTRDDKVRALSRRGPASTNVYAGSGKQCTRGGDERGGDAVSARSQCEALQ